MVPAFLIQGLLGLAIAASGTKNHLTLYHQANLTLDKHVWLMFDFPFLEDIFVITWA